MPNLFSPFAYRFLTLPNQTKIAYLDEGPKNAPVILFLHGLGDNSHIWDITIAALKTNFRCIALDLPGHGKTTAQSFKYQMFEYADCVVSFLAALKLSALKLVGHSMGGQISIILSLRFPALIEKLILVAPAGFEQFTESEKNLLQLGASYGNGWQVSNIATETARQTTLQKSLAGMLSEPVFDFLPQLQTPTLVIFGEQDTLIPNRYLHRQSTASLARTGTARIPNAELQLFPRCGHYPQTEQASHFNATVSAFIK